MLALSQLIPFLFPKIHAEEISGNNGYVELSFCAKKLDDKVRSDAFLFPSKNRFSSINNFTLSVLSDRKLYSLFVKQ